MRGEMRNKILAVCANLHHDELDELFGFINEIEDSLDDIGLEIIAAKEGNIEYLDEAIDLTLKLKDSLYWGW